MPKVFAMDIMDALRADLASAKGTWPRLAEETGIDYFTIARIARGVTKRPRIDTVEMIRGWIKANPPKKAA